MEGHWVKARKDFPPSMMTSVKAPHYSCKLSSEHHTEAMASALAHTQYEYK